MDFGPKGNHAVRVIHFSPAFRIHLFYWELFPFFDFSTISLSTALWSYLFARNNMIIFCWAWNDIQENRYLSLVFNLKQNSKETNRAKWKINTKWCNLFHSTFIFSYRSWEEYHYTISNNQDDGYSGRFWVP